MAFQRALPFIFLGFGLLFLLTSVIVGWVVFPKSVQGKISQQVRLEEGSLTFGKWQNITTPIYIKYYIFNVTNPNDVLVSEKPILDEKGPYVYEQKRVKTINSTNLETDTVTYRQTVTYFFRPDLSVGSEDDLFTIINIPLVSFTAQPTARRAVIAEYVAKNDEQVFIQRTVSQLLFKGYFQPTIKDLSDFAGREILPNNTFGLYYGKNGTAGNVFEVHRGVRESSEFGEIVGWKGAPELDWWGGKECNMINGSDGSIFPPFVSRDRTLRIFSEELCRSLYLTYAKDVEYHGIPGYRFSLPKELLARADENPDNACFCQNIGPFEGGAEEAEKAKEAAKEFEDTFGGGFFDDGDEEEEEENKVEVDKAPEPTVEEEKNVDACNAGVILLKACREGKPVAASTPHFLFGEAQDVANAIGIHPLEEKHETYIDLEPNTGLVLQASKKIQINIQLSPTSTVRGLRQVPKMLLPVLWADEYAAMPEEKAEEFKDKLLSTLKVADVTRWSVLVVSGVLIIAALAIFLLRARKDRNRPKF